MFKKKDKSLEEVITKQGYDPYLLSKIQPVGGISFRDEKYIKMGDGNEACVHISSYRRNTDMHWLAQLMNIGNSIVTVDISTEDIEEVKRNINRSVKEQKSRYRSAKEATEIEDAQQRYAELQLLYQEISSMGEIVKDINTRIFLAHRTVQELDNTIATKIKYLESNDYKGSVYLNESAAEWKSFYQSATYQNNTQYKRLGQPVPSETLAGGNPFHFTSLSDPNGSFLGTTLSSRGSVLLDLFYKNDKRTHYSAVLSGTLGSGKSTALKKIVEDMAIRGNFIRGFDVSGEFARLILSLGGKMIALDGTDGIINILEILPTDENESVCYATHISKLKVAYRFLSPQCDQYETIEFEEAINGLYKSFGFRTDNEADMKVTGLPSANYPIWSDFLAYIDTLLRETQTPKDSIQKELLITKMQRLNNIRLVISNLVNNFGNVVNGHTSIDNISATQIVFFDISKLKNLKPEIFDIQFYNALFFCWGNAVQVGKKMLYDYNDGKIAWEDIIRTLIVFDEAHRIINANKLAAVEQLLTITRESRKYFTGLLFASQSVRDFFPESSTEKGIEQIRTLFELMQYRFLMKQSSTEVIERVFNKSLTPSEIASIPQLSVGECILSIAGDRNIKFKIHITDEENRLFTGGA